MIHKKIFSILALLSLAVSGAWAQDTDITVSPTENACKEPTLLCTTSRESRTSLPPDDPMIEAINNK